MTGATTLAGGDRVFITGASGFIGRHLAAALDSLGVEIVAPSRAQGFDIVDGPYSLAGVRHVFHLAGETFVPDAWKRPVEFYRTNALGTVAALEASRAEGCSFTHVSAYVYGVPSRLPIAETDPVTPNNPYAFSKHAGEEACRWYARTHGMRVTSLRVFNVYGPGQAPHFLIPTLVRQAVDPALEEIELLDLEPRRDYVHIQDVVSALLASIPAEPGFAVYNVGSGGSVSVRELAGMVMQAAGTKPIRSLERVRTNEIPDVVADVSALSRLCGWQPRVPLARGLADLVAREQGR